MGFKRTFAFFSGKWEIKIQVFQLFRKNNKNFSRFLRKGQKSERKFPSLTRNGKFFAVLEKYFLKNLLEIFRIILWDFLSVFYVVHARN